MRTVILLGAGASYGSIDVAPYAPPLGTGLFKELERLGGIAAGLSLELKKIFHDDFERGMAAYYESSGGDTMGFQRELSLYFARFRPGPSNVYVRLVQEIGVRRVLYSSLNYDLLFELSASMLRLGISYSTERLDGYVRLLKLHGSSNFWPDLPRGMIRGSTFKGFSRADIQVPIKPLDQDETIYRCQNEDSLAPAIAIYAEGKAVKVSPDYVEKQQAIWIRSVNRARKVFVIGARVHPIDQHIWGTLGQCKADLTYFGLPSDQDDFLEWKEEFKKRNAFFLEADFSHSISIIKRLN